MSFVLMDRAMKVAALAAFERGVLVNLAWRADRHSSTCWPSIAKIVGDTGISERQVFRALKSLRMKGLIVSTGWTKHGTTIYMVVIPNPVLSKTVKDEMAVPTCHPDCSSLPPWHTNKDSEHGKGTESMYTSPEESGPAYAPATAPQKAIGQDQPPQPAWPKKPAAPATMAGGAGNDSKVVAAWKTAHANAGLPCHVSGQIGKQLGAIAKAAAPIISYSEVLNVLIPVAVAEWGPMCQFMAGKYGIFLWGAKPLPKTPHAGFLLEFRKAAYDYCSQSPEMREWGATQYGKAIKPTKPHEFAHPLEYGEDD
jgi:hypothetical protein